LRRPWPAPTRVFTTESSTSQDVALQPLVAERAAGVKPLLQCPEVLEARVERSELGRAGQKQLPPVRPRAKGPQRGLEQGQDLLHLALLTTPCEVNADRVCLVLRAQPQPVGGHRAD